MKKAGLKVHELYSTLPRKVKLLPPTEKFRQLQA